jgi:putative acetyltransferase
MKNIVIRPIRQADNAAIAAIIRRSLKEFHADKPGTVYFDDSTDHLFELFRSTPGSLYLIAENDQTIIGGAGIFPTDNLPDGTCELVKLYLSRESRGSGTGSKLMDACFDGARKAGYRKIYLETMPELKKAVSIYERAGFKYLSAPLGNSGHDGCDIWMVKEI